MKEWERFLSGLEHELTPKVVDLWLRPLRIVRFDAANLYLEAADPMAASWFEEHIRPRLKYKFYNENNRPIRIHIQVKGAAPHPQTYAPTPPKIQPDSIEPTSALDSFAVCSANEIAYKLLNEWTVKGTVLFNPIFLFGPKGSGKSHLLMGTAAALSVLGKRVFFVRANTFTEHVVQAIRAGTMQDFRKVYRDIDVLLVDDVDQLAGRAATQEEFFHTFNTLHTAGKQILLTSQLPPSKLQEIEPRLISRFEWGIALGIDQAPIAQVLKLKAKAWNLCLSDELFIYLIQTFPSDPVLPLQALAVRSNGPVTIAAAQKLLADLIKSEAAKALTPEQIVKSMSAHFGITSEDLLGKSQTREFAIPRQIAMYVCRQKLNMPFQAIGKLFGRDHSTVMSSVKQIQKGIDEKKIEWIEAAEAASKQNN